MRFFKDNYNTLLTAFLLGVVGFSAVDLIDDYASNESWVHIFIESSIVIFGVLALVWMWRMTTLMTRRAKLLGQRLAVVSASSKLWRERANTAVKGLSVAIDQQMSDWKFTPSEKDVSLLLLKGLSMKEIAEVRSSSERTVRQQAQESYRKAGLAGRAEFAAFFLEDLLLPRG